MSRLVAMRCAVLLFVAAGCVSRAFLTPLTEAPGYRQVVAGPPARVVSILEAGLGEAGTTVLVKREKGEARLVGQTRSGEVFCLYVRPDRTTAAERTVITVRWDQHPDGQLWATVGELLTEFTAPEGEGPSGSPDTGGR
jgi:hypothetical protein